MIIISIGRDENNRIVLEDPVQLVSNYQAELRIHDNGNMFLFDKSSNGTFVNGVRIPSRQDFPVYRGNMVLFANKIPLNWTLVPEVPAAEDTLRIMTIGKHNDNEIRLGQQDRISRHHALLRITKEGDYYLYDMSTNGTLVNNLRIPARSWYKVKYGDHVSFGGADSLNWKLVPAHKKSAKKVNMRPMLIAAAVVLLICAGTLLYPKLLKKDLYKQYESAVCLVVNQYVYTIDFGELGSFDATFDERGAATLYEPGKKDPVVITGTGFFISKDGKLMTNRHVASPWMFARDEDPAGYKSLLQLASYIMAYQVGKLKQASEQATTVDQLVKVNRLISAWANAKPTIGGHPQEVSVLLNNTFFNSSKDLINCEVLHVSDDEKLDIGLLQTNNKTLPAQVKSLVSVEDIVPDEELRPGKKIFTLGFPMGLRLAKTSQGIKANFQDGQVSRETDGIAFGHNMPTTGGASGSPVFDEDGRLAGVHYSGVREQQQGYKFAITASRVKKLLATW